MICNYSAPHKINDLQNEMLAFRAKSFIFVGRSRREAPLTANMSKAQSACEWGAEYFNEFSLQSGNFCAIIMRRQDIRSRLTHVR